VGASAYLITDNCADEPIVPSCNAFTSFGPLSPTLAPPSLAPLDFYSWIVGGGHRRSIVLITLNSPTAS